MRSSEVLQKLKLLSNPEFKEGMARFGINIKSAYGVKLPHLRKLARNIGKDHVLAQELWLSGIHEARLLATMVADSKIITEKQMDEWVKGFNSWDICDQCCGNLFDRTKFAHKKAVEWTRSNEEFVKRAGFALMATLAVHDKKSKDEDFIRFLPLIKKESTDDRNFVKKAVNWALRQIGKRNMNLNKISIQTAKEIQKTDSKSAKWVASNALSELTSEAIQKRLACR